MPNFRKSSVLFGRSHHSACNGLHKALCSTWHSLKLHHPIPWSFTTPSAKLIPHRPLVWSGDCWTTTGDNKDYSQKTSHSTYMDKKVMCVYTHPHPSVSKWFLKEIPEQYWWTILIFCLNCFWRTHAIKAPALCGSPETPPWYLSYHT